MLGALLITTAAPVLLVLVALGLAAVQERRGSSRPRLPCSWRFLQRSTTPLAAGAPAPVLPQRRVADRPDRP